MKKLSPVLGVFAIFILCSDSNDGCTSPKQQNAISNVSAVHSKITVKLNSRGHTAEQQNLLDRNARINDPTKIFWFYYVSVDGRLISRASMRSKSTSSGKRLEAVTGTSEVSESSGNLPLADSLHSVYTTELVQPDGTFGSSEPYQFWFDVLDRYFQKGLDYLITDFPIDMDNQMDKVSGLYRTDSASLKWQLRQEAMLEAREKELALKQ